MTSNIQRYRKRKYRKNKKRFAFSSKSKRRARVVTVRLHNRLPIGGFYNSKTVRLKYVTEITMDAASGATAYYDFCANGLYDPDITSTGHQPMNFDTWMTFYDHYTVLGSKIRITPALTSTSSVVPSYIGLFLGDDTDIVSGMDVTEIMENKKSRYIRNSVGVSNAALPSISSYFSAKKFFRRPTKVLTGASQYQGDVGNNPTEKAIFEVWQGDVGGNNPGALNLLVEMEFVAIFTEPKKGVVS